MVAAGLEQDERPLELNARLAIITGKPAREPGGAVGDAGFRRIGSRLDVVEEGFGVSPHL